ncbi:MAG: hypothetical protein ABI947_27395 [Chloroflexota bacterium]
MKAELRRRTDMKGKANPENTRRFSGLIVCAECRYRMVAMPRPPTSMRCASKWSLIAKYETDSCGNTTHAKESTIQEYLTKVIARLKAENSPEFLTLVAVGQREEEKYSRLLETETKLRQQIDKLIDLQLNEEQPSVIEAYAKRIQDVAARLDTTRVRINQMKSNSETPFVTADRESIQVPTRDRDGTVLGDEESGYQPDITQPVGEALACGAGWRDYRFSDPHELQIS